MSSKDKHSKFDPKRIQWGYKLLGGAFALWLVGLILNPIANPMMLWIGVPIRLMLLWGVTFLQLAAVILAAVWLYPVVRRRKMRLWSLALMVTLIVMSTLYHLKWLTSLGK